MRGFAGGLALWFAVVSSAGAGHPLERIKLKSDQLSVMADTTIPRVHEYVRADGGRIMGSLARGAPSVVITRRVDGANREIPWAELSPMVDATDDAVVFHCTAKMDNVVAVTFDYAIRLEHAIVTIGTEKIEEKEGYDLDRLRFPDDPIIRVTKDMPGAKAAFGNINGNPGRIYAAETPVPAESDFGLVYTDKAAAGIYCNTLTKPIHARSEAGGTGIWCGDFRYSFKEGARTDCGHAALACAIQRAFQQPELAKSARRHAMASAFSTRQRIPRPFSR